jgi:hypothetical protein
MGSLMRRLPIPGASLDGGAALAAATIRLASDLLEGREADVLGHDHRLGDSAVGMALQRRLHPDMLDGRQRLRRDE